MEKDPIAKSFSWSMVTPARTYYVHGSKAEERDEWMDIIRQAQKEGGKASARPGETSGGLSSRGARASLFGSSAVNKDGYLWKVGGKKKNGQWQKRWFSLKPDNISYFGNQDAKKAKGVIDLNNVQNVEAVTTKKPNTFILVTPGRVYYVAAATLEEQDHWIESIKHNIKLLKKDS